MWKTAHENLPLEPLGCHLCPDCDSLGPHVIITDGLPGDNWLECIDCGAVLGCLTPHGLETDVELEPMEPVADEIPQQMDGEILLEVLTPRVPEGDSDPERAHAITLIAALLGWQPRMGRR